MKIIKENAFGAIGNRVIQSVWCAPARLRHSRELHLEKAMHKRIGFTLAAILLATSQLACAQMSDTQNCVRHGGKISANLACDQEPETRPITYETPGTTITIRSPELVITDCQASIALEYSQRGALARVEGRIENEHCAASTGSFVVSIRTADDNREQSTQDYEESWQRTDDQPIAFSKDYPIGDNVDLVRVRSLKSTCKCGVVTE